MLRSEEELDYANVRGGPRLCKGQGNHFAIH